MKDPENVEKSIGFIVWSLKNVKKKIVGSTVFLLKYVKKQLYRVFVLYSKHIKPFTTTYGTF